MGCSRYPGYRAETMHPYTGSMSSLGAVLCPDDKMWIKNFTTGGGGPVDQNTATDNTTTVPLPPTFLPGIGVPLPLRYGDIITINVTSTPGSKNDSRVGLLTVNQQCYLDNAGVGAVVDYATFVVDDGSLASTGATDAVTGSRGKPVRYGKPMLLTMTKTIPDLHPLVNCPNTTLVADNTGGSDYYPHLVDASLAPGAPQPFGACQSHSSVNPGIGNFMVYPYVAGDIDPTNTTDPYTAKTTSAYTYYGQGNKSFIMYGDTMVFYTQPMGYWTHSGVSPTWLSYSTAPSQFRIVEVQFLDGEGQVPLWPSAIKTAALPGSMQPQYLALMDEKTGCGCTPVPNSVVAPTQWVCQQTNSNIDPPVGCNSGNIAAWYTKYKTGGSVPLPPADCTVVGACGSCDANTTCIQSPTDNTKCICQPNDDTGCDSGMCTVASCTSVCGKCTQAEECVFKDGACVCQAKPPSDGCTDSTKCNATDCVTCAKCGENYVCKWNSTDNKCECVFVEPGNGKGPGNWILYVVGAVILLLALVFILG